MGVDKNKRRQRIHWRIRKKVSGTSDRPRLSVYRSNKNIYCQVIDDTSMHTLMSASTADERIDKSKTPVEQAKAVGKIIGELAKEQQIETVIFDRGGYLYHGRVKALADGAREAGLKF